MDNLDTKRLRLLSLGMSLWVSFLWACVATMLFFATFDPIEIARIATFPVVISRTAGYSIGFLFFWLLLALNGLVINWFTHQNLLDAKQDKYHVDRLEE